MKLGDKSIKSSGFGTHYRNGYVIAFCTAPPSIGGTWSADDLFASFMGT